MEHTSKFSHVIRALPFMIILMITGTACATSQAVGQVDQNEFAQTALQDYVTNVLNDKNVIDFGFTDVQQAAAAKVGQPYKEMFIGLQDLKAYKAGSGLQSLMRDAMTLWYPVQVEGRTITKIEIVSIDGKWVAGEFGGTASVQVIDLAIKQLPELIQKNNIKQSQETILLKIPVVYANFLYVQSSEGEYLVPALIQPQQFNLEPGQIYPADKVLSTISRYAQEIDADSIR